MLVNEVVDEVPGVLVLQGFLIYSSFVEKLLQIWINIFQIKAMVWIPANVADVLEIAGHANVFLLELPLLHLLARLTSLVPSVDLHGLKRSHTDTFNTSIPTPAVLNGMLGSSVAVDPVAILLLPAGLPALPSVSPLGQLGLHGLLEDLCFCLISKVEPNLGIISLESVEVRAWCLVPARVYSFNRFTIYVHTVGI